MRYIIVLDNLFNMVKADRYTDAGRQQINDAKYQVGQISQKTGLQKQQDGTWAPPKNAQAKSAKKEENKGGSYLGEKEIKSIYNDIKNNGLEDYTPEQIAKEYKLTKGDAEKVHQLVNNKTGSEPESKKPALKEGTPEYEAAKAQAEKIQAGVDKYLANKAQAEKIQAGVDKYLANKDDIDKKIKGSHGYDDWQAANFKKQGIRFAPKEESKDAAPLTRDTVITVKK